MLLHTLGESGPEENPERGCVEFKEKTKGDGHSRGAPDKNYEIFIKSSFVPATFMTQFETTKFVMSRSDSKYEETYSKYGAVAMPMFRI